MASQCSVGDIECNSTSTELPAVAPQQSHSRRLSTGSSANSEKYSPLQPGFYMLDLHGTCSKCKHYHKGSKFKFSLSGEPREVSHICCTNCGEKWLALGGHNTTRISLLSTQTTEPDHSEVNFRYSLMSMVRSATAIASPSALATVSESSSMSPSGGILQESPEHEAGGEQPLSALPEAFSRHNSLDVGEHNEQGEHHPIQNTNTNVDDTMRRTEKIKNTFTRLKQNLRTKLHFLEKMRSKAFTRPKENTRVTVKGKEKQRDTHTHLNEDEPLHESPRILADKNSEHTTEPNQNAQSHRGLVTTVPEQVHEPKGLKKEDLAKMSKHDQYAWLRHQFSQRKCRCKSGCKCKPSISSHDTPTVEDGTGLDPNSPPLYINLDTGRRHSIDFLQMGGQFDYLAVGTHVFPSRPLSITTATWNSQVETAVSTITTTSRPQHPYVNLSQQERQRSISPRPHSVDSFAQRRQRNMSDGRLYTGSTADLCASHWVMGRVPPTSSSQETTLVAASEAADPASDNLITSSSIQHMNDDHTSDEPDTDSESDHEATPTQSTPGPDNVI